MKLNATQFGQRVITALLFGIALLVPLFIGKVTGLLILGVLCLLTIMEYLQLQGLSGYRLLFSTGLAMLMYLGLTLITLKDGVGLPVKYGTYLALAFSVLLLYRLYRRDDPFLFSLQVLPATLYVAIPFALLYAVAIWSGSYKPIWLVAILLFVWINDIMAYLVGRSIGRRPFSRQISPNKTWEGTIAGWLGCLIMALLLWKFLGLLTLFAWVILGSLVGITSSIGDLVESLFKRKKEIKDSGTFLPGHGGFLDRLDSLLFAAPFIALFFIICM
ncbi:MAG: phosphatidate cytidylyltransferase [Saprospiraceae bacterium]|nr:phosphatidate cytidylyltransferase [Saprospiraceae bacterium]